MKRKQCRGRPLDSFVQSPPSLAMDRTFIPILQTVFGRHSASLIHRYHKRSASPRSCRLEMFASYFHSLLLPAIFRVRLHEHLSSSSLPQEHTVSEFAICASLQIFLGTLGLEITERCAKTLCCVQYKTLKRTKLEGEASLHENMHAHYFIIHLRSDKLVCKNSVSCSLTILPMVKSLFILFQTPL